ncbi:MAG: site-specific integrase [Geminicoccaceae bacterium]|jgi:site-specific recombinase XerD
MAYLKDDRGLSATTIKHYVRLVRRFLTGAGSVPLLALSAQQIIDFFRRNAPKDGTFADAKSMATALRSFLQFAHYRGYVQTDLVSAVPVVAGWSMASIPRDLPAEHIRHLLTESRTWRTPAGLRNRAILLLLARVLRSLEE